MPHQNHSHQHPNMLSVEEALLKILSKFSVLDATNAQLEDSIGMVTSEDVFSALDIPPTDNSAMDGYAVISKDIKKATPENPVFLHVISTIAAGEVSSLAIRPGTAIRIMTGAPIPEGADSVVPFEETTEMDHETSTSTDQIGIKISLPPETYIRNRGSDIKKLDKVISSGTKLTPPVIGVLASLGHTHVKVYRRPIISVLATGNELVNPGLELMPGKIYDSNTSGLVAAIKSCGATPRAVGIASDDLETLNNKITESLDSDLIITSAGVSKGDYDVVKDVLNSRGDLAFWSVRMRPAKPLAFGTLRKLNGENVPVIGLPGNPVSALVAFQQFCIHAINKMMGRPPKTFMKINAILENDIHNFDGRRVYARVKVRRDGNNFKAQLTGNQDSNVLTSMATADGLAICPENMEVKSKGENVEVIMLDWDG